MSEGSHPIYDSKAVSSEDFQRLWSVRWRLLFDQSWELVPNQPKDAPVIFLRRRIDLN